MRSDARKALAAGAEQAREAFNGRDHVAARIVHKLTCGRCRMGWYCGGLSEDDYEQAAVIASDIAHLRASGHDELAVLRQRITVLADDWEARFKRHEREYPDHIYVRALLGGAS